MTVSSTQVRQSLTGDGVTTSFPTGPVQFYLGTDLSVYLGSVLQSSGYTVSGGSSGSSPATGTVTFATPPANGVAVQIILTVPLTQLANFVDGTAFPSATIDQVSDRAIQASQRLDDRLRRALVAPDGDVNPAMTLAAASVRASKFLTFDSSGNPSYAAGVTSTTLSQATIGQLLYPQIAAEGSAGVTPVNYAYFPQPIIDPNRYHTGTIGNAADDLAAVTTAISVLKQIGGTVIVPSNYSTAMTLPSLALSNNQAGCILDLRLQKTGAFGALEYYMEARDNTGGYASELRIKGKQNPELTIRPLSDGTAAGFSIPNHMCGISTFTNSGNNNFQLLVDPYQHGRVGAFALEQYAQGTSSVSIAAYYGIDANNKTRIDFMPSLLSNSTINISSVTNTTPVVVNLASPHGITGGTSTCSIAGVTAALNTSWEVSVSGASQLTLLGSVASGAFGAVGTATVYPNSLRAPLNVPKGQGINESICAEGQIASAVANGTAPITVGSQTADVNLTACPLVYNVSGTQQNNGTPGSGNTKVVIGNTSLSGGAATVNLSSSAQFTGANTYKVVATDITAANAVKITRVNGGQFTLAGTGTDSIDFIAVGF